MLDGHVAGVSRFMVETFLSLNLVVGAILNNYRVMMAKSKRRQQKGKKLRE